MHIRFAIKFITCTIALAALLTAGIAFYTGRHTPRELVDLCTMVAIGIGILGAMMARGARIGDGPIQQHMTTSVADSPNATRYADYVDMIAGMSYGALIIVSAVLWMIISACLYQLIK